MTLGAAQQPLVSIGVPTFNEREYLKEALDSLIAQDYANLEFIVIDNASTDGTDEICATYAARDPRITYRREPHNTGATANFHRVFQESRGEFFSWASGHDLREPSAVRRCVEVLRRDPEAVLCYPRTLLMRYGGDAVEPMDGDTLQTSGLRPARRLRTVIQEFHYGNAMYGVFRSAALRRVRLPQPILFTDVAFLAEMSLHGGFTQLDDRLFIRRENRPPPGDPRARIERQYVTLDPSHPRRAPRFVMLEKLIELEKAAWRAPQGTIFRLSLTPRVAWWVARQGLSYRRFQGLARRVSSERRAAREPTS